MYIYLFFYFSTYSIIIIIMVVILDIENNPIDLIESNKIIQPIDHLIKKALFSSSSSPNECFVDDTLHVVTIISNVCEYKRRWQLMREFIERMESKSKMKLYIVELAYGDEQTFHITDPENPQHLQLRTPHAIWHKENLINIAVDKLLPHDWKAVAWIDGDLEFENGNWVEDTLKVLTVCDVIQLFTTCFDLDEKNIPMSIWQSYGYKYAHGERFKHNRGINYWHSGYAWACRREFFDAMGGLYERGILGSGDYIMTQGFLGNNTGIRQLSGYCDDIAQYNDRLWTIRPHQDCKDKDKDHDNDKQSSLPSIYVGYIPGNIRHFFHGSKINRKYVERNQILIKHAYDPSIHLMKDSATGLLIPSPMMSTEFLMDIYHYFAERNEDEMFIIA